LCKYGSNVALVVLVVLERLYISNKTLSPAHQISPVEDYILRLLHSVFLRAEGGAAHLATYNICHGKKSYRILQASSRVSQSCGDPVCRLHRIF
jgi:hypothetical protein